MIRRLLRWLCRHEIAAEVQWERAQCECGVRLQKQLAYAQGKLEGNQEAFAAVEQAMRERMGGGADVWSEEDLARAKKGLLH